MPDQLPSGDRDATQTSLDLDYAPSDVLTSVAQWSMSRTGKVIETVWNGALFIALMIIYGVDRSLFDYSFPLEFTFPRINQTTTSSGLHDTVTNHNQDGGLYQAGLALAFIPFAALVGNLVELATWNKMKKVSTESRRSPVRWICDSIANPLTALAVYIPFGVLDVFGALTLFVLVHVSTLLGLVMEAVNSPGATNTSKGPSITTYPILFSWWVSALSFVPILCILISANSLSYIGAWEWVTFAMYAVFGIYTALVQTGYYMYLSNPRTASAWPYSMTRGSSANFMRYDFLSGLGFSFWRGVITLLAMAVALRDVHWETPSNETVFTSYYKCGDNPKLSFDSSCAETMFSVLDNYGNPQYRDFCAPKCPNVPQVDKRRRLAIDNTPSAGSLEFGVDLGLIWLNKSFIPTPSAPVVTIPLTPAFCTPHSTDQTLVTQCTPGKVKIPAYISYSHFNQHAGKDSGFASYSLEGQTGYHYDIPASPGRGL